MRLVTMALSVLAVAIGHAEAQDGTLRPAHCSRADRASLMVHRRTAPPFPVVLASLPVDYANARWRLVQVGEQFGILSYFTQYGTVAITVAGNGSAGEAVVASPWTGSARQLWNAVNPVDRAWYFAWGGTGMALKTAGDQCNHGRSLILGPNSGNNSWVWNDP